MIKKSVFIQTQFLILSFWVMFSGRSGFAQTPDYDSTFQALFRQPDDSVRAEKLFYYFDDMYQYEGRETAVAFLPMARKMLDEATRNHHTFGIAKANQALAYLHKNNYEFAKALQFGEKAEAEWVRRKYYKGIAEIKFLKATLLVSNGRMKEMAQLGEEAMQICREHKLSSLFIEVAGFVCVQYSRLEQYDKAIRLGQEILKTPGLKLRRRSAILADLGISLKRAGRFKEAWMMQDSALAIARSLQLPVGPILGNMSELAYAEKKTDLSIRLAEQAEAEFEKEGVLEFQYYNYRFLAQVHTEKKNFEKALHYAQLAGKWNDSLNKLERQSEFRELEKKYESQLKSRTIEEQKHRIAEDDRQKQYLLLGIAGLVVISVLGAFLFYVNRKRKEGILNQSIAESEMKALRAQMNPHFIFNSLNAIQQMVNNHEYDNASRYLDTYSKVTRQILENSEKKWITVRDEVRFLELYLQIESLRFDGAFEYLIETGEDVMPNSHKIPAMVVQPIVENAIKHGLLNKVGDRRLRIYFSADEDSDVLEITVEDNGIGREAAAAFTRPADHHSMSLTITQNRLQLVGRKGSGQMEITDLRHPDGTPAGTRVRILITQPV